MSGESELRRPHRVSTSNAPFGPWALLIEGLGGLIPG